MKKLTSKEYWEESYTINSLYHIIKEKIGFKLPEHYYYYELKQILKKFIPINSKNILEIGCSSPYHLITLSKEFNLQVNGIDYSAKGIQSSKNYLKKHGINTTNIKQVDFFDKKFQKQNKEKYDIVSSFGFIEHFTDPKQIIKKHCDLVKKNGLIIIGVPNLSKFNKSFFSKKTLQRHNLKICSMKIKQVIPKDLTIKYLAYAGGTINLSLYFSQNKIIHSILVIFQIIQRLSINQIFKILYNMGINPNNKYASPNILLVGAKNA